MGKSVQVVLVYATDDWEAIYINGVLKEWGNPISTAQAIKALEKQEVGGFTTEYAGYDWFDKADFSFPLLLKDVEFEET